MTFAPLLRKAKVARQDAGAREQRGLDSPDASWGKGSRSSWGCARMERALGAPLDGVQIYRDGAGAALATNASALAVTHGQDVAFAPGAYRPGTLDGDVLLAHELAHTIEQRGGEQLTAVSSTVAEASADRAALLAALQLHDRSTGPSPAHLLRRSGLALRRCDSTSTQITEALDGRRSFTPALAQRALDQYASLSEADRQRLFDRYYPTGGLQRLLAALPAGTATAGGTYNETVQDILRRAQRQGVLDAGNAAGLHGEAQLAQAQATFMHAQNVAAASASLPAGALQLARPRHETARPAYRRPRSVIKLVSDGR